MAGFKLIHIDGPMTGIEFGAFYDVASAADYVNRTPAELWTSLTQRGKCTCKLKNCAIIMIPAKKPSPRKANTKE